jgi:sulfur carrier protein ThiS
MKIRAHLYGTLRRFSQPGTPGMWQGEFPTGTTMLELIRQIGASEREVAVASINGNVCALETQIPEEAKIVLVTHMGAG